MAGREEIRLIARFVEPISARACRVELANGHRMVAHVTKRNLSDLSRLRPGEELTLIASPFDFSKAGVIDEQQNE